MTTLVKIVLALLLFLHQGSSFSSIVAVTRIETRNSCSTALLPNVSGGPTRRGASLLYSTSSPTETDEEDPNVTGPFTLLLLSQFLLFIGVGAVIPSIPLYGKELGFSSAANGIVISAPAVALLLLSQWGGNFADQARKPAMIAGMAIIAVSDLGTSVANNLWVLLVARLGLGAGRCISEAGERGLLADLANQIPALRGRALAAQQAMVALGIAIGAPLGGIVVEQYGPRAAFLCVTAAACVAMVIYCFLPETIQKNDANDAASTTTTTLEKNDANGKSPMIETVEWGELLSLEQWKGLALAQSGASFGFAAKIACIPVLATSILPGGAVGAGALVSAAGLSGLIGAPIGGFLTDRAGAKATAILSGIVSAISLMLIPAALATNWDDSYFSISIRDDVALRGNALAFCVAVLGWSIGAAAQGPALTAFAQRLAPKGSEATSLALPKAAGDGTYIVAPFLLGLATDYFHLPGVECAVAGSATLLGVLALAVLANESQNQEV